MGNGTAESFLAYPIPLGLAGREKRQIPQYLSCVNFAIVCRSPGRQPVSPSPRQPFCSPGLGGGMRGPLWRLPPNSSSTPIY